MPGLEQVDNDEYLKDCLTVETVNINEEYARVPADIARWNERLANATREHADAKLDLDSEKAKYFILFRSKADPATGKTPSVEAANAMVDASDDIIELARNVNLLDAERIRIRGIVYAVEAKKDMIQSLGAHLRQELRSVQTASHTID